MLKWYLGRLNEINLSYDVLYNHSKYRMFINDILISQYLLRNKNNARINVATKNDIGWCVSAKANEKSFKELLFLIDGKRGYISISFPFLLGIENGLPLSRFLFRQFFLSFQNPAYDEFITSLASVFIGRGINGYFGACCSKRFGAKGI